jgi:hypothetical protein
MAVQVTFPRDRRMQATPLPILRAMVSARPRLVCLPSRDHQFTARVELVLAGMPDARQPAELEAALRDTYPSVVVRASELSGLRTPTWYVYRDGTFPWPSESVGRR